MTSAVMQVVCMQRFFMSEAQSIGSLTLPMPQPSQQQYTNQNVSSRTVSRFIFVMGESTMGGILALGGPGWA